MNKLTRDAKRAIRQQQRYDEALAEIERLKVVNLDLYEALKEATQYRALLETLKADGYPLRADDLDVMGRIDRALAKAEKQ